MALIPINVKVSEDTDFYITAEDDAHIYSRIVPSGVISSVGGECRVSVAGNDFVMKSGLICIQGYFLRVTDNHRLKKLTNVETQYIKARISLGETEDSWKVYVSENNTIATTDLFKGAKIKEILIASFEGDSVRMENLVEGLPEVMEELRRNLPEMRKATQNETERVSAERDRQQAESTRQQKENERLSAENVRVNSESARVREETTRNRKESERQNAELSRISRETERQSAETTRQQKENERLSAETQRETWFENTKRLLDGNPIGNLTNEFNSFKSTVNEKLQNGVVENVTLNSSDNSLVVRKNNRDTSIALPKGFSGNYNDLTNKPNNLATTNITDDLQRNLNVLSSKIGNTSNLRTNSKNDIVGALNELFQLGTDRSNIIKAKVGALAGRTMQSMGDVADELEKYVIADDFSKKREVKYTDFTIIKDKNILVSNDEISEINTDFRPGATEKITLNLIDTDRLNFNVPLIFYIQNEWLYLCDVFKKNKKKYKLESDYFLSTTHFPDKIIQIGNTVYSCTDSSFSKKVVKNLENNKRYLNFEHIYCGNSNYILVSENRDSVLYNAKNMQKIRTLDFNLSDGNYSYKTCIFIRNTSKIIVFDYSRELIIYDCANSKKIKSISFTFKSPKIDFIDMYKSGNVFVFNDFAGDFYIFEDSNVERLNYYKFNSNTLNLEKKSIPDNEVQNRKIKNVFSDENFFVTETNNLKYVYEKSRVLKKVR